MQVELVAISEIKSNPSNPRVIRDRNFKKLVDSIKGFEKMLSIRPLVVDENMVVLGGNMRLKACKEVGLKQIPVIKVDDLTEEQKQEFIIKDNVGFGEWDWDILANAWDEQKLIEWGLDIPTFEPDDIAEDIQENSNDYFQVTINCESEEEQNEIYKKLIELGFNVQAI